MSLRAGLPVHIICPAGQVDPWRMVPALQLVCVCLLCDKWPSRCLTPAAGSHAVPGCIDCPKDRCTQPLQLCQGCVLAPCRGCPAMQGQGLHMCHSMMQQVAFTRARTNASWPSLPAYRHSSRAAAVHPWPARIMLTAITLLALIPCRHDACNWPGPLSDRSCLLHARATTHAVMPACMHEGSEQQALQRCHEGGCDCVSVEGNCLPPTYQSADASSRLRSQTAKE